MERGTRKRVGILKDVFSVLSYRVPVNKCQGNGGHQQGRCEVEKAKVEMGSRFKNFEN